MAPVLPLILVVEDDAAIRVLTCMVLEVAGYSVVEAASARHALTFLDAPNDVALVFSDIQMRGSMTGIQLAHHLHAHYERLLILLTSGVPRDEHNDYPESVPFLAKPYDATGLLKATSDLLVPITH